MNNEDRRIAAEQFIAQLRRWWTRLDDSPKSFHAQVGNMLDDWESLDAQAQHETPNAVEVALRHWQRGIAPLPPAGYHIRCTGCSRCALDGHLPIHKEQP